PPIQEDPRALDDLVGEPVVPVVVPLLHEVLVSELREDDLLLLGLLGPRLGVGHSRAPPTLSVVRPRGPRAARGRRGPAAARRRTRSRPAFRAPRARPAGSRRRSPG